jgi:hypothetical protein
MRSSRNDDDNDGDNDEVATRVKLEVDIDDDEVDAFVIEREANRRVNDRLMLPRRVATSISQTVTALAWTYIILGFVLNSFGYAFVRDGTGGGFRIDTVETRMFQEEVVRSMRTSAEGKRE